MSSHSNRILVAEDHPVSRHLLERILSNWGFQVSPVVDGNAALQILESADSPALALIDWMMPGMDGLEVCRRVRATSGRPYLYLILLTVKNREEEIAMGLDAGTNDYIVKPVIPNELRARLKLGLRMVELERRLTVAASDLESTVTSGERLKRLLPICIDCRKIRDDADYWREIEQYLNKPGGADLSQGRYPACKEKISRAQIRASDDAILRQRLNGRVTSSSPAVDHL